FCLRVPLSNNVRLTAHILRRSIERDSKYEKQTVNTCFCNIVYLSSTLLGAGIRLTVEGSWGQGEMGTDHIHPVHSQRQWFKIHTRWPSFPYPPLIRSSSF